MDDHTVNQPSAPPTGDEERLTARYRPALSWALVLTWFVLVALALPALGPLLAVGFVTLAMTAIWFVLSSRPPGGRGTRAVIAVVVVAVALLLVIAWNNLLTSWDDTSPSRPCVDGACSTGRVA